MHPNKLQMFQELLTPSYDYNIVSGLMKTNHKDVLIKSFSPMRPDSFELLHQYTKYVNVWNRKSALLQASQE